MSFRVHSCLLVRSCRTLVFYVTSSSFVRNLNPMNTLAILKRRLLFRTDKQTDEQLLQYIAQLADLIVNTADVCGRTRPFGMVVGAIGGDVVAGLCDSIQSGRCLGLSFRAPIVVSVILSPHSRPTASSSTCLSRRQATARGGVSPTGGVGVCAMRQGPDVAAASRHNCDECGCQRG